MKKKSLALSALLLIAPTQAMADDFWCTTSVSIVGEDGNGNVWLALDNSNANRYLYICNMMTNTGTCQGMMSIILSAKGLGKTLTMRVGGSAGATSCATLPVEWTTADNPSYLATTN